MFHDKKIKISLLIIFWLILCFKNIAIALEKNNQNLFFDITIKNLKDKTQIIFQSKYHINYSYFFLQNPYRFVIDFKNSNFSINNFKSLKKENLYSVYIKLIRFGIFKKNIIRLVLELQNFSAVNVIYSKKK
ncbi:AMIN domain-containing protein [Wigglesworthia glossinidia]|uniref:AMIN domain-containing protein n=1 Tax=Wigglesworthia glossinidia TaxID=51229 RepID=UPI0002D2B514|nr:AMIN domain-containing protein [Wigglesworthia glossinidia]